MLVPAMNLEEVRSEVERDLSIVYNKAFYVQKEIVKKYRPRGNTLIRETFDYVSKYRNRWICRIDAHKKHSKLFFLAYFYGDKGLNAFMPFKESGYWISFTAHFFNRYCERKNLSTDNPNEVMKEFLTDNDVYCFHKIKNAEKGKANIFCLNKSGVLLGTEDTGNKWYSMKTFVRKDMLHGDQIDICNSLEAQWLLKELLGQI
jgi:hypothetical protein